MVCDDLLPISLQRCLNQELKQFNLVMPHNVMAKRLTYAPL